MFISTNAYFQHILSCDATDMPVNVCY